jgi:hypothetical protein
MDGLQPGRITVRICAALRNATGKLSMNCLNDFDLQPKYPIDNLLRTDISVKQDKHSLIVTTPINKYTIKRLNTLVTNYWFQPVLLYGDAGKENGLYTENEDSVVYEIKKNCNSDCRLSLVLPEQPWIALLKINCIEGNEPAAHPKLYGMTVIAVGE